MVQIGKTLKSSSGDPGYTWSYFDTLYNSGIITTNGNLAGDGMRLRGASYIKLNFTGEGIRLIGQAYSSGLNDITVIIDDIKYKLSRSYIDSDPSANYDFILLMDLQLKPGEHYMVIINPTLNDGSSFAAIEVKNGSAKKYDILAAKKKYNISSMTSLGDNIECEYTASPNTFGSFANMGAASKPYIPALSSSSPDGTFRFLLAGYTYSGEKILIPDRNIQHSIDWFSCNKAGLCTTFGTKITIDNRQYRIKLPTVGLAEQYLNNDWMELIALNDFDGIISAGDNNIWNWSGVFSWGLETPNVGFDTRCTRGYSSVNRWLYPDSSVGGPARCIPDVGVRPMLIVPNNSPPSLKFYKITPTHVYKTIKTVNIIALIDYHDDSTTLSYSATLNTNTNIASVIEKSRYKNINIIIDTDKLVAGNNKVTITLNTSNGDIVQFDYMIIKEENYRLSVERTFKSPDGGFTLYATSFISDVVKSSNNTSVNAAITDNNSFLEIDRGISKILKK